MGDSGESSKRKWLDWIAFLILQSGVSLLLLSRGWLTWRWDSPLRELIWEEKWWTPVLAKFDITWGHFARTSDTWITPTLERTGIFLMVSAAIPWLAMAPRLRWMRWLLIPAILIVGLDAFARWVGKDMQAGMAMEYALRFFLPVALLIYLGRGPSLSGVRRRVVTWMLLLAASLTFTGHGLYAMGYYDIPLAFRIMTTEILAISEEASLAFLTLAGWLDFLVVALVFFPGTRLVALIYMMLWGGATTGARIWAYYEPTLPWNGLDPWLAEALVRTPHFLVPLWLILMMRKAKNEKGTGDREDPAELEGRAEEQI